MQVVEEKGKRVRDGDEERQEVPHLGAMTPPHQEKPKDSEIPF